MFEQLFKAEMKRLNLRRYDVCKILDCTMQTKIKVTKSEKLYNWRNYNPSGK